jgi:hypothetical protein
VLVNGTWQTFDGCACTWTGTIEQATALADQQLAAKQRLDRGLTIADPDAQQDENAA